MKKIKRLRKKYKVALVVMVLVYITLFTTVITIAVNGKDVPDAEPVYAEVVTTEEYKWMDFTATAYCSCEICCEEWAYDRPLDEYGNPIVYGASCQVLHQGISIAADWDVLDVNTKVEVDGIGYFIVQDRGGSINGNEIDVYFEDHEEAAEFGIQNVKLRVIGEVE